MLKFAVTFIVALLLNFIVGVGAFLVLTGQGADAALAFIATFILQLCTAACVFGASAIMFPE